MNIFEAAKLSKDGRITVKNYVSDNTYFNTITMKWEDVRLKTIYPLLTLHEMNMQNWGPYEKKNKVDIDKFELVMVCQNNHVECYTIPKKIDVYRILGLLEMVKFMYVRDALQNTKGGK